MTRLVATYDIESPVGIQQAADVIAGEQSTGTFVKLAAETDELRERSAAVVESVEVVSVASTPALACKKHSDRYERGVIRISWPVQNFGTSLPNLLATIAGNLFELSEISAIRLLDIELPHELTESCPGPKFGIAGTRSVTGIENGPIIGTIIKPSIGLDAAATAELVAQLASANIDFIKDDELQANGGHCPFTERVEAVMKVLDLHEEKTGKRIMYAFNITDDIESMRRHYDLLVQRRACCAMVSLFSVGLSGLLDVRRQGELVIHGHRAGWGLYSRSADIGIAFTVWQKLWRLAGADHLHVNGFANKFSEPDTTVANSALSVQAALSKSIQHCAMPVFSSAQTVWQMAPAQRVLGNSDFILTAGGGIMSHPDGPAAGVVALRQAAESVSRGVSIEEAAKQYTELGAAIKTFSKPQFDV